MLVLCGAGEELAPRICGVGFPFLLAAVQRTAALRSVSRGLVFAIAAGAFEDALSAMPLFTSVSFFLLAAVLARWSECPRTMMALTYPVYQVWLWLWMPNAGNGVFFRILAALPVGVLAALAVGWFSATVERRAGIDG